MMKRKITQFYQGEAFCPPPRLKKILITGACIAGLSTTVLGQNLHEVLSLEIKDGTLTDALSRLDSETKFSFTFPKDAYKSVPVKAASFQQVSLDSILTYLQEQYHIEYFVSNQNIIFHRQDAEGAAEDNLVKINGVVTEDKTGNPVNGATIRTASGVTYTNEDGAFTMYVPKGMTTFRISCPGYDSENEEVSLNAPQKKITFEIRKNGEVENDVVVTALGIKKEEKSLGYAVSKLDNKDFTDAQSNNWTNNLEGRVAGLNLIKSNGGPAGSNKIILRGENSLSGNSDALIVVDGVVISSSSGKLTGTGSGSYLDGDSPVDFGSSLSDINPEDIANVTVLKGPGATALYGARGANGAIVITTKSGHKRKGIGVSFNTNTTVETISRWPDFQYEYGQGVDGTEDRYSYGSTADGTSTKSTSSAWGPKFNGQQYFQYNPNTMTGDTVRSEWKAYPNNKKDFFQSAITTINNLSLEGGNSNTNARISYTNLNNRWIVPNTGYKRNTVALAVDQKVNSKLKISTHINYTNKSSDNLPVTGYNNQSIMYFIRGLTPNVDLNWFEQYWVPGQEGVMQNRPFSSLLDNPYLIVNEDLNKVNRNNMIGNVSATYEITPHLNVVVRANLDWASEYRSQQRAFSSQKFVNGMFRTQNIFSQEFSYDALINYDHNLGKNFNLKIMAGGTRLNNKYVLDDQRADQLMFPGVYSLANSKNLIVSKPYRSEFAVNSLYGVADLSYKDMLFLDITGRNDWTSVLATPSSYGNSSFFYPSVNVSAIISEMAHLPAWISYWKLRGSWAQVGSGGTTPYLTAYNYSTTSFPSGLENPTAIANPNLKPLMTTSNEIGTTINFLSDRVGLDVAYYVNNTRNQIISAPIDNASGYATTIINAGKVRNNGVEVSAFGKILAKRGGLNWRTFGTYSMNRNKVITLAEGVSAYIMQSSVAGRVTIQARPGGPMGAIYGLGYKRTPDGSILYSQGLPQLTDTAVYLGNTTPKWRGSWGNEFSYKGFTLSFLFDGQFGGVAYSLTHAVASEEGKLKSTLPGRYTGIIGKGEVLNSDGSYSPNTVVADAQYYYQAHYDRSNVESNTFSTDYIKLREARIGYTFSREKLKKIKYFQSLSIGLYGRDLLMFTNWPSYDPEFGTMGDGVINAGVEIGQFPSTRSFGINVSASF